MGLISGVSSLPIHLKRNCVLAHTVENIRSVRFKVTCGEKIEITTQLVSHQSVLIAPGPRESS